MNALLTVVTEEDIRNFAKGSLDAESAKSVETVVANDPRAREMFERVRAANPGLDSQNAFNQPEETIMANTIDDAHASEHETEQPTTKVEVRQGDRRLMTTRVLMGSLILIGIIAFAIGIYVLTAA